jgi:hypothetical protein
LVESAACAFEIVGVATNEQIKAATSQRDFNIGSSPMRKWIAHAMLARERMERLRSDV